MHRFNRGLWKLPLHAMVVLALAISIGSHAQEGLAPEDEVVADFLEGDRNALRELAAEYASKRIDFLDISYLEPDSDGSEGGFTVAYKWNVQSSDQWVGVENGRFAMRRTSYSLDVDGKYAFNDALNNHDLSTVSASFALQRGDFGKLRMITNADAFQDCLVDLEVRFPEPPEEDDAAWEQYRKEAQPREDACWTDHGIDEVAKAYDAAHVYGVDFHAMLEGNQNYDDSHFVFGLSGLLAMQPSSETHKRNVFDFPFRLMRESFSNDSSYVAPWPSIKIDVDRVDASGNETREALTTDSTFTRANGEITFQTILASVQNQPVRFNISYRYFYEFSAPSAIKAANMDSFDYLALSLRFPARLIPIIETTDYEFFFSYTNGQLPFDLQSEKAFEVGIGTNINQLARLFGE